MQATDARKAFPCLDEPAKKATFDTTLIHPKGWKARSNEEQKGDPEDVGNNMEKTSFKTTPKMSTYLVAFLVSEFEATVRKRIDSGRGFPSPLSSNKHFLGSNPPFSI